MCTYIAWKRFRTKLRTMFLFIFPDNFKCSGIFGPPVFQLAWGRGGAGKPRFIRIVRNIGKLHLPCKRILAKPADVILIILRRIVGKQKNCLGNFFWKFPFQIPGGKGCIFQYVMKQGNTGGQFILHLLCNMDGMENIRDTALVVLTFVRFIRKFHSLYG